ncbi:hypothetical protein HPB47_012599 [Ixodes persulcatus]|uniref:Uncharacterized protein n=1 Tax=Ixodes persulcatus TaxID=34615 RepID=A0AC60NT59_IXOPE|nr:hypothetical protein HPB47_012599 [Ixodes persulcatus]
MVWDSLSGGAIGDSGASVAMAKSVASPKREPTSHGDGTLVDADSTQGALGMAALGQALQKVAGEQDRPMAERLSSMFSRLSLLEKYMDDLTTERRNLKNELLTLQDENLHLQMALNRERKKVSRAWSQADPASLPRDVTPSRRSGRYRCPHQEPEQDPHRSLLPLILPWKLNCTNENDLLDLDDVDEEASAGDLHSASIPTIIRRYRAITSLLSWNGASSDCPPRRPPRTPGGTKKHHHRRHERHGSSGGHHAHQVPNHAQNQDNYLPELYSDEPSWEPALSEHNYGEPGPSTSRAALLTGSPCQFSKPAYQPLSLD